MLIIIKFCFSEFNDVHKGNISIQSFQNTNLASVKHITDVNAKVPLQPHNVSICTMQDLTNHEYSQQKEQV